jgi:hypothetical protein
MCVCHRLPLANARRSHLPVCISVLPDHSMSCTLRPGIGYGNTTNILPQATPYDEVPMRKDDTKLGTRLALSQANNVANEKNNP